VLHADATWILAACPKDEPPACAAALCATHATSPACGGAAPDADPPPPGYATPVEAAHLYLPGDDDDGSVASAIVGARLLGLAPAGLSDADAVAWMRDRMGVPTASANAGEVAGALHGLGADTRRFREPTLATLALAVDCGCPTYLSYLWHQRRHGAQAVLLVDHDAGEGEAWLVSYQGSAEAKWRKARRLAQQITHHGVAVAFCPPDLSASCTEQLDGAGVERWQGW
jgi:hypothetical protein